MKTTAMTAIVWEKSFLTASHPLPSELHQSGCHQSTASPDRPVCDPVTTVTAADANATP